MEIKDTDVEICKLILKSLNPSIQIIRLLNPFITEKFIKRFKKYCSLYKLDGRIYTIKKRKTDFIEKHILQGKRAIFQLENNGMDFLSKEITKLINTGKNKDILKAISICFELSSIVKEMAIYYRTQKTKPIFLNSSRLSLYRRLCVTKGGIQLHNQQFFVSF